MLNNRYFLKDCLHTVSGQERLYQAYDRQAGGDIYCIVQFFSKDIVDYHTFSQIKEEITTVNLSHLKDVVPHLPVTDLLWENDGCYFIMRGLDSWAVNLLPTATPGHLSSLHQKAGRFSQSLLDARWIESPLQERHCIVTPDGELYVLGTVFSPSLQLRLSTEIVPKETPDEGYSEESIQKKSAVSPSKKRQRFALFYAVPALFAGGVFAGSYSIYQSWQPKNPESVTLAEEADTLLPAISSATLQDKPLVDHSVGVGVVIQEQSISNDLTDGIDDLNPMNVTSVLSQQAPMQLDGSNDGSESILSNDAANEGNVVNPVAVVREDISKNSPALAKTVRHAQVSQAWLGAESPKQLVERIDGAMKRGNWQSALYYTRVLSRQDPDGKEALHCAGIIVETFHEKVERLLTDGEIGAARYALNVSEMALKDFDLPELHESHQRLKVRLNQ